MNGAAEPGPVLLTVSFRAATISIKELYRYSAMGSTKGFDSFQGEHMFLKSLLGLWLGAGVMLGCASSLVSAADAAGSSGDQSSDLQEVIVTAEKRAENLLTVPAPVTALSAESLSEGNSFRLQDYYASIPGLTVSPAQGQTLLSIRGLGTGNGTNPTVAVSIDDAPFGASTSLGGGNNVPDIDPGDLARIEVLRGPQGVLYGASGLGGLVKFVTIDPSTEAFSGRVQAGASSVYNGAELGYNVRGSVNIPLSDNLAVRASGFFHQDPGYIDNPVLGVNGVNEEHADGGRVALLWRPTDTLSVKLSALYQHVILDGSNDVNLPTVGYPQTQGLSDLQEIYPSWPGNSAKTVGGFGSVVQAYAATVTAKLGVADLTSVTAYNINTLNSSSYFEYVVPGLTIYNFGTTDKLTQELRLDMPLGKVADVLLGAFFDHENSNGGQDLDSEGATGAVSDSFFGYDTNPLTYREYAVFADATFHLTDKFDVQVGGRESFIRESLGDTEGGLFFGGPTVTIVFPEVPTNANAFTYLFSPSYKLSEDLMFYARLASGYRPGGGNIQPPTGSVPSNYSPDKTNNYEIGAKGEFFDHRLVVDTSVFYIDWKDIQLLLTSSGDTGYNGNASRAKSEGVELAVQSKPLAGLTVSGWVDWDEAVLTEGFPQPNQHFGVPGDPLPFSARFSGNLSVQQDFPLWKNWSGFVGGALSYIGDRKGEFGPTPAAGSAPQRTDLPAYAKTDVRLGAKSDLWTVNLYVNNVADRRGLLSGGIGYFPPFAYAIIQPRTVGLNVVKIF